MGIWTERDYSERMTVADTTPDCLSIISSFSTKKALWSTKITIGNQDEEPRPKLKNCKMNNKPNKPNIEEEIKEAQEFISLHPVLQLSPGDLQRDISSSQLHVSSKEDIKGEGMSSEEAAIRKYLEQWPKEEQKLWLEYFEEEL